MILVHSQDSLSKYFLSENGQYSRQSVTSFVTNGEYANNKNMFSNAKFTGKNIFTDTSQMHGLHENGVSKNIYIIARCPASSSYRLVYT